MQQYRPALVVGQYIEADSPTLLWVLMITSASHRRWVGDVVIADRDTAGLPSASIVRSAKIATVEAQDAGRIGILSMPARQSVRDRLSDMITRTLQS